MKLSELEKQADNLELAVYDTLVCYKYASLLHKRAWELFNNVLDYFDLYYCNFGEPEARNTKEDIVIPLTSCQASHNDGMLTSEEEEAAFELPNDLYWARLRMQQSQDILTDGWQSGLEYPEEVE